jgi:hypothetical protein
MVAPPTPVGSASISNLFCVACGWPYECVVFMHCTVLRTRRLSLIWIGYTPLFAFSQCATKQVPYQTFPDSLQSQAKSASALTLQEFKLSYIAKTLAVLSLYEAPRLHSVTCEPSQLRLETRNHSRLTQCWPKHTEEAFSRGALLSCRTKLQGRWASRLHRFKVH